MQNGKTYPRAVANLYKSNGSLWFSLTDTNTSATVTDEMIQDSRSYLLIYISSASGQTIVSGTIKPMLYQDGDGTWEPYTGGKPAPNPDFPMEIENVEINKVFSSSGNMLNLDWNWEHNKVSYAKINESTIKASAIDKKAYPMIAHVFADDELEFIKGKSIKLLLDKKESSKTTSAFQAYYTTSKGSVYINSSSGKHTIPKDIIQFVVQLVIVNSDNLDDIEIGDYAIFTAPRILVGDVEDTSWKPYGFSAIETSLTLAEGDTYENGQVTRLRKQITFDGSSDEIFHIENDSNPYISYTDSSIKTGPSSLLSGAKCNRLVEATGNDLWDAVKEGFSLYNGNSYPSIRFRINGVTEKIETFKTWLQSNPLTVEYELATPTTEELKIPTIPSYYPYTEVSTDNTLETDMTWKVLADCDNSLKQEALEKRIEALEQNALGE